MASRLIRHHPFLVRASQAPPGPGLTASPHHEDVTVFVLRGLSLALAAEGTGQSELRHLLERPAKLRRFRAGSQGAPYAWYHDPIIRRRIESSERLGDHLWRSHGCSPGRSTAGASMSAMSGDTPRSRYRPACPLL